VPSTISLVLTVLSCQRHYSVQAYIPSHICSPPPPQYSHSCSPALAPYLRMRVPPAERRNLTGLQVCRICWGKGVAARCEKALSRITSKDMETMGCIFLGNLNLGSDYSWRRRAQTCIRGVHQLGKPRFGAELPLPLAPSSSHCTVYAVLVS